MGKPLRNATPGAPTDRAPSPTFSSPLAGEMSRSAGGVVATKTPIRHAGACHLLRLPPHEVGRVACEA